ncbi:hypothetical protein D3C71_2018460 [compost metagenome]
MNQRADHAHDHGAEHTNPGSPGAKTGVLGIITADSCREGAKGHQTFNSDIDYARTFREDAAQRGKYERCGEYERRIEHLAQRGQIHL